MSELVSKPLSERLREYASKSNRPEIEFCERECPDALIDEYTVNTASMFRALADRIEWLEKEPEYRTDYMVGDYVIYAPHNGGAELGRVLEVREDGCVVCYHEGCTATITPFPYLKRLNNYYMDKHKLGFHRFDEECPEYNPQICSCKRGEV